MNVRHIKPLNIAVIGSGISGLSAAWLLSKRHNVSLFEKDDRLGGHSNTVEVNTPEGAVPVDTGFIVFNPVNYPNLVEFFKHLNVDTTDTDMTFGVSLEKGKVEYSGSGLGGFFAQRRNLLSFKHWGLLREILTFYKDSDRLHNDPSLSELTLGQLLAREGYSQTFINEHLLPMSAAIWSTPMDKMLDYPAETFMRFCMNHGLVQVKDRPQWRTVIGGSRQYVNKVAEQLGDGVILNARVHRVERDNEGVTLIDHHGQRRRFDQVVFACHADQTLEMLADATPEEKRLLSAFPYQRNRALLHTDNNQMPVRKSAWSAWNYLASSDQGEGELAVTYWMNALQPLKTKQDIFVTLNPIDEPQADKILGSFLYDHPAFDQRSIEAQKDIWSIQGEQRSWFCGAWMGYGFHEDGIQSGLAVAEQLGGALRPWTVDNPSGRIHVQEPAKATQTPETAA